MRIPSLGPRGEGWVLLQAILLVAIPVVASATASQPDEETPLVVLSRAIGAPVLLGGIALIAWSMVLLRRRGSLSALPRPVAGGELVEAGPYRVVRHPIYAGLVLAALGVTLIRVSPPIALLTVALFAVLDAKRRREEAWLLDRFPEYADYRRRTRALIPFVY